MLSKGQKLLKHTFKDKYFIIYIHDALIILTPAKEYGYETV